MFTSGTAHYYRGVSVAVAVAIVVISGYVMDRGHLGATPRATVEFAQLQSPLASPGVAMLPEVVVTAPRLETES